MDKMFIIVPCYNEEAVLPQSCDNLLEELNLLIKNNKISEESKIIFVDDGSKDKTWMLISQFSDEHGNVGGIKLSRNKGHQNALLAGLMSMVPEADMMVTIDADLQDDVKVIEQMVDKYHEGNDIVYGVRSARKTDTFFKKTTAEGFYKLTNMLGGELIFNHADFRLMSKRAVLALSQFDEVNLFLRGLIPMLGFPSEIVTYERHERAAGETKYPLKKMISFAVEGITSLSVKPIQLITKLGMLFVVISIVMFVWMLIQHFSGNTIEGWTSILCSLWFIGGVMVFSIGMIGEYIGKIYLETKHRPKYFIEEIR